MQARALRMLGGSGVLARPNPNCTSEDTLVVVPDSPAPQLSSSSAALSRSGIGAALVQRAAAAQSSSSSSSSSSRSSSSGGSSSESVVRARTAGPDAAEAAALRKRRLADAFGSVDLASDKVLSSSHQITFD